MWTKYKWVIVLAVALLGVYLLLFPLSRRGYGYTGYGGYHRGPSFLYWGGTGHYYPSQSTRTGSAGGPNVRGGGIRGGK